MQNNISAMAVYAVKATSYRLSVASQLGGWINFEFEFEFEFELTRVRVAPVRTVKNNLASQV